MTTDITGTVLLENSYKNAYDYYVSILGSGNHSHNTIAQFVQDGDYENFTIGFIRGIKHQAYHHTGKDDVINELIINDISSFISSIFNHYTQKPELSAYTHLVILEKLETSYFSNSFTANRKIMQMISYLKENSYEKAIATFILYLNRVFELGNTITNRLKSDLVALINQLDVNFTSVNSLMINDFVKDGILESNTKKLDAVNISVRDTKLGGKIFVSNDDCGIDYAHQYIDPTNWSVSELRAIADYMEENPNMTFFKDGSGKPVKP